MTDFELQRRLRDLNTPHPPRDDLWPTIALRMRAEPALPQQPHRRSAGLPLAAAASVLVALGGLLYFAQHPPQATAPPPQAMATAEPAHRNLSPRDAEAFARERGTDPRLVGAAVVLDAAHAELEQALEQRPDATFLVGLLARTHARRLKLDHYGARAG